MATFEELMESFRNPGENGVPETFADDLTTAYTESLSIRDAAVADREAKIAAANEAVVKANAESVRLKAVNYDLLMAAPKAGTPDNKEEPEESDSLGVDSLFE